MELPVCVSKKRVMTWVGTTLCPLSDPKPERAELLVGTGFPGIRFRSLGKKRLSGGRMCLLWLASNLKGLSWRWRHQVQFLKVFFLTKTGPKSIDQSTNQPINPSQVLLPIHYLHPPTQPCLPWETRESAPGPCGPAFCSDNLVSTRVPGAEGTAPPSL